MNTLTKSQEVKVSNKYRREKCPVCGSSNIINKGTIDYHQPIEFSTSIIVLKEKPELWSCLNCESAFTENIITKENAEKLYTSGQSSLRWDSSLFELEKTTKIVETIGSLLKPGQKVLDIGCAGGEFLDFAKKRQCITYGLEYSAANVEYIKNKGHIAYSSRQEVNEKFDLITAFDVVEHLYDINQFIDFCLDRLSINGQMVIVTGDILSRSAKLSSNNWWYIRFPDHIVFPSIKYFKHHPKLQDVQYIQTCGNKRLEKNSNLFVSIPINLLKLALFRFSGFPPLKYDHMIVIARPNNEQS